MKKILFAASEGVPFIKTGGLADVVGSLPKYLDKTQYDVRIILPKYSCIRQEMRDKMQYVTHFYMDFAWRSVYVGILEAYEDGIHYYFIDNEEYFTDWGPYSSEVLVDVEKFIFFSKAVLSCLPVIDYRPDLIHCHDWQTGLIPVYLKENFSGSEFFRGIKSVMTIHNLKFQGRWWDQGFIRHLSGLSDWIFTPDKLESYGEANLLKGGLVYADAITTVSPQYAKEIQSEYYGEGLDGLLRARCNDLRGILNGIDYAEFNPDTDMRIFQRYNAFNYREEKIKNKREVQKQLGLEQDDNKLMIGMVTRLSEQKGLDLVAYIAV